MNTVREFAGNRLGNFGMIMAILAVPIIGSMGAAIDYSMALNVRSQLMGAADAAALGVISESSKAYQAASTMNVNGEVEFDDANARALFMANAPQYVEIVDDDFSIEVHKNGEDVSSVVDFSVPVPTSFMKIFGYDTLTVSGSATATTAAGMPAYIDVHMLLDNSPSMGLGATINDINALIAATSSKCAFACHEVWNSGVENPNSNYKVARAKGITLRIDVLRQSVVNLVDYAIGVQGSAIGSFRFAAYTMGKAALESGHKIDTLSGLTTDLPTFRNAVNDVALMTTPHSTYNEDALTSFENGLGSVNAKITQDGGSGASSTDRQQIVLFVTDGVGNSIKTSGCQGLYSGSKYRCIEPIDLDLCQDLKDRNITVAVLYTTYFPVDDHLYNHYIKKFATSIAPRLEECASPDLFAEVNINGDMRTAIRDLFAKATIVKRPRLTG